MKTKIRVEAQVEAFVKSLAPDPRRRLRLAIRGLADGRGDTKSLEGNLADYCRLSVTVLEQAEVLSESWVGEAA